MFARAKGVLDTYLGLCYSTPRLCGADEVSGRIAQLVEQLTLNQRVQGSSPCAPTTSACNNPPGTVSCGNRPRPGELECASSRPRSRPKAIRSRRSRPAGNPTN